MRTINTTLGPVSVADHMYDDWQDFFRSQNLLVTEEVIVLPEQRTTESVSA